MHDFESAAMYTGAYPSQALAKANNYSLLIVDVRFSDLMSLKICLRIRMKFSNIVFRYPETVNPRECEVTVVDVSLTSGYPTTSYIVEHYLVNAPGWLTCFILFGGPWGGGGDTSTIL